MRDGMPRESFVFCPETQRLVPKHEYRARTPRPARSDLPCPMISRDYMAPGVCQIDGKTYDSKSALSHAYREYESRTGQKLETVGDADLPYLTRDVEQPLDKAGIQSAIKTAMEKHAA